MISCPRCPDLPTALPSEGSLILAVPPPVRERLPAELAAAGFFCAKANPALLTIGFPTGTLVQLASTIVRLLDESERKRCAGIIAPRSPRDGWNYIEAMLARPLPELLARIPGE